MNIRDSETSLRTDHVGVLLDSNDWELIVSVLRLSRRESQIVRGLIEGREEGTIAADLAIAPRTVHAHVERLYRKLRVHSRHQLTLRIFGAYIDVIVPSRRGTLSPDRCRRPDLNDE